MHHHRGAAGPAAATGGHIEVPPAAESMWCWQHGRARRVAGQDQTASRLRPLRRRAARIARPARVRIRSRKPWVLCRRRLCGWKVRLLTSRSETDRRQQWTSYWSTRPADESAAARTTLACRCPQRARLVGAGRTPSRYGTSQSRSTPRDRHPAQLAATPAPTRTRPEAGVDNGLLRLCARCYGRSTPAPSLAPGFAQAVDNCVDGRCAAEPHRTIGTTSDGPPRVFGTLASRCPEASRRIRDPAGFAS